MKNNFEQGGIVPLRPSLMVLLNIEGPLTRGSATPMKMGGGDGDQAAAKPGFSSEGNPYKKPKTQRIWSTIFLKMGGIIPRTLKNGGTRPPPPLWRSPCLWHLEMAFLNLEKARSEQKRAF